jgi:hypothetical protein
MKNKKTEKEVPLNPTQGETDIQKQSTEYNELIPRKHPHGEKSGDEHEATIEHPHEFKTIVDEKKTRTTKGKN